MLYHHDCVHLHDLVDEVPIDPFLPRLLSEQVNDIWKNQGFTPGTINPEVTKAFQNILWNGVGKGYGKDILGLDYDTPDFNMIAALRKNVSHFSAAKNYTQLRQLTDALLDNEGKLRSFEQFKEAAHLINQDHIGRFLKAEYELAVAGSQMAGKWVDIQANKKILPLLQLDAVLDSQTTDLCKGLDGTTLPVDHPFWNNFYPPNHWGCRSTVRQLASGAVTPERKIPSADIPFKVNLGKQGLIFPKDHPYFNGLPSEVAKPERKNLVPPAFKKSYGKDFKDNPLPDDFWKIVPEDQHFGQSPSQGRKAGGDVYFMPPTGDIIIKKGKRWKSSDVYRRSVVVHESGHAIHFKNNLITYKSISPNIEKRMKGLLTHLEKDGDITDLASKFKMTKHFDNVRELAALEDFEKLKLDDLSELLSATLDTVNGVTLKGGSKVIGYGHSPLYMTRGNNAYMELFAHSMENKFLGNPVFKHYFPNLYQETIDLMDDIIKNELQP